VETMQDSGLGLTSNLPDLPLVGIVGADPQSGGDEWIEVIAGESPDAQATHCIPRPSHIRLAEEENGQAVALQIESAEGSVTMIVRFPWRRRCRGADVCVRGLRPSRGGSWPTTGMFLALGTMVGRTISQDDLARGLRADGVGTLIGGIFNTFPYTSFSQNVGLVGVTGVTSPMVCVAGGGIMLLLGLPPTLAFIAASVPQCVLGGAGAATFGMVAATGIRILAAVDYDRCRGTVFTNGGFDIMGGGHGTYRSGAKARGSRRAGSRRIVTRFVVVLPPTAGTRGASCPRREIRQ